jgi:DNA/RNA-binding domain of Phe-tRNA-synthetase-like protein
MMQEFIISDAWKEAYPQAAIGVLALRGVANPERHAALDQRKEELEDQLRARFAGHDRAALKALPILQAYNTYYKQFRKTYHVQLQLESVVFSCKSIPRVAALVEAMFMAELEDLLLTAGHDLESLQPPIGVYVADGSERYTRINGQEQTLKVGDMFIADAQGVISSVLYGPDQRTRITPRTRQALFTAYGPAGIEARVVHQHLNRILANIQLFAPDAVVESLNVYGSE